MISLNNFVTININYEKTSISGSLANRPTVVVLDDSTKSNIRFTDSANEYKWSSLDEFKNVIHEDSKSSAANDPLFKMLALYFNNGGKEIHYFKYDNESDTEKAQAIIKALDSNEIVITACSNDRSKLLKVAAALNSEMIGINEKLYLISKDVSDISDDQDIYFDNCVVKIGDAGIEMTTAAYLSKVDIDRVALKDYCFTEENLGSDYKDSVMADNTKFKTIKDKGIYNVNITLARSIDDEYLFRNYGGNTSTGLDLVNYYTKIILSQTLTQRLYNLLATKIKYSQASIALISATITDELSRYIRADYLSTDKIWTGGDIYDRTGKYLLLANNTRLTSGYSFTILPLDSLSETARANHQLPEIHLFLADAYTIRQITLSGKIF